MKPVNTIYRLSVPRDVPACKRIWAENEELFGPVKNLSWPTVIAERNGRVVGFMSTKPGKKFLLAGPLIMAKDCRIPTAMRLVEAYEVVLRMAKVTAYWFHVERGNSGWLKMVDKLAGFAGQSFSMEENEDGFWFKRKLV